jgi:hypothetical protein
MKIFPSILMVFSTLITFNALETTETHAKQAMTDDAIVQAALAQLNQYAALQNSLQIQDADLAYAMKKAVVIADLLIGVNGQLQLGLLPLIQSAFIPNKPEEYEINMQKFLNQFDLSWKSFFDRVKAPKDPHGISSVALRALFSLKANEKITDRQAKVAVLAAMLAPYNQGPVGDCFAVNDVIRDHTEYYHHIAEDCASVVMNGYVERPVNNTVDAFFFLPVLADDDLDQTFTIASDGTFSGTKYSLFDAPGFLAARALMGGEAIPSLENDILQSLNVKNGQIQMTPAQLIQAMAQAIAGKIPSSNVQDLDSLGKYAFSSLTNNPILRGVESAFAAMAEDRPNDSTRGNINACVAQALKPTWAQLGQMEGISEFQQTFAQAFNHSYHLLYNLMIPLPQVAADGSSTDGGFQLYQRHLFDPTKLGKRIATPEQFQQLVLAAVGHTVKQLGATNSVNLIANHLSAVIGTDDFLKNALWDYDPSNQQQPDPIGNYQKLSRTPMQSCDGDNPFEVDDIDTGKDYDDHVQVYTPHNARDLINWCLNLAKVAPPEFIPMDSPQHAFNFAPMNPDLVKYLFSQNKPSQWLQKRLIATGMQVAKRQMDLATQQTLTANFYQLLSNALDPSSYQQLVQGLMGQTLNIQEYAQKLLDGVNALLGSDPNQAQQVALGLDAVLLQTLPAVDQAILQQAAIRFAFTNWNEGTKDIYFCAFFNPRTEQIGFGTIFEDKTNLQPMDENAWVNNQQWDVDLMPFAPMNLATNQ